MKPEQLATLKAMATDRTLWNKQRGAEIYTSDVDGIHLHVDASRPQGAIWQVRLNDDGHTASAGNCLLAMRAAVDHAVALATAKANPVHIED